MRSLNKTLRVYGWRRTSRLSGGVEARDSRSHISRFAWQEKLPLWMQATASIATFAIAAWTVFFSPLSDYVERQLRLEILEGKQRNIEVGNEKIRLEKENEALEVSIISKSAELSKYYTDINALSKNKEELEIEIFDVESRLKIIKNEILSRDYQIVLQLLNYYTNKANIIAKICAEYDEYKRWLLAQIRIYELYYQRDDHNDDNWMAKWEERTKEVQRLQKLEFPEIWLKIPKRPVLRPTPQEEYNLITQEDLWIIGESRDPNVNHDKLVNYFFSMIVLDRGAKRLNQETLLQELLNEPEIKSMEGWEVKIFVDIYSGFFAKYPEFTGKDISIVFQHEPSAEEIVKYGKSNLGFIRKFNEAFATYLSAQASRIDIGELDLR